MNMKKILSNTIEKIHASAYQVVRVSELLNIYEDKAIFKMTKKQKKIAEVLIKEIKELKNEIV